MATASGSGKRQFCAWCGEDLGTYPSTYGVTESCGKAECEREIAAEERGREEDRAERAAADGYERY